MTRGSAEAHDFSLASAMIRRQGAASLEAALETIRILAPLFDAMPDVVFFVKDTQARYRLVNRTLATRLGVKNKEALIGKTTRDLFPAPLGDNYAEQDRAIIDSGTFILDRMELHLYPGRQAGWCMTSKIPITGPDNVPLGVAGISRDIHAAENTHPAYKRLAEVAQYVRTHCSAPISLDELASMAGMSIAQLERYFQKIFHLSPRQMLLRTRLEMATALLARQDRVTEIAAACGYADHSAFTRQFKATVGVTPKEYRAMLSANGAK